MELGCNAYMQVESLAYLQEGVSSTCVQKTSNSHHENGILLLAESHPSETTAHVSHKLTIVSQKLHIIHIMFRFAFQAWRQRIYCKTLKRLCSACCQQRQTQLLQGLSTCLSYMYIPVPVYISIKNLLIQSHSTSGCWRQLSWQEKKYFLLNCMGCGSRMSVIGLLDFG